ncbi:7-cyano-7-deazaguanine synthase [Gloeomargarita lithophora Alchichica-D10]|uniref:7-cyano-7-deazaguanine synthase n=2 Tax=Gloeomargarita TaxID=1188227 RepID=A0A1J0AH30_9CYAN|nr:7-cyano-7-deazaguanine synthase [Gloeomargarita lithophora Alchichica-D10]
MNQRAIVLLSGGLDSATVLYHAQAAGDECYALSFDYQQRHRRELHSAQAIAHSAAVHGHEIIPLDLGRWGGSALTQRDLDLPRQRHPAAMTQGIPITYVPARNTIFLSLALAWAEVLGAKRVYLGANALDYSGYPDCREDYLLAMQQVYTLGTKRGREGQPIELAAPLLHLHKGEIIQLGQELGVPWELTWSCYQGEEMACGMCDSCILRREGFRQAGIEDPLPYAGT